MAGLSPIVLLTDFGSKDHYAGVMKGVILSISPRAGIVDLTHEVPPHDVLAAAYLLRCSVPYFPAGSVFAAVVDPGVGTARRAIAVKADGIFLIGPDNGIFDAVMRVAATCEIRAIVREKYFRRNRVGDTFHGRDIFAPVAARLCRQPRIFSDLGPKVKDPVTLKWPKVRSGKGSLRGEIIYVDRFGNAITNLTRSIIAKVLGGRRAGVCAGGKRVGPIHKTYEELTAGRLGALYNSEDDLELAYSRGSAARQARLSPGTKVEVRGC